MYSLISSCVVCGLFSFVVSSVSGGFGFLTLLMCCFGSFVFCFVLRTYHTSTVLTFNFLFYVFFPVFFHVLLFVLFVLFIINLCLLLYFFFVCFSVSSFAFQAYITLFSSFFKLF